MKILKNEKASRIVLSLMLMSALVLGGIQTKAISNNTKNSTNTQENKISVAYNTHIQYKGWESDFSKKDGQTSGTSGQSLRLEGIKIKLLNAEGISIKYQTHIQNVGWQNWKSDGEMAGTSGQSLRLEGIRIKLENTEKYSIMYRVHVQNIGWQDWKYDGEMAGTSGQSLRLEAIEIKIIDKVEKGTMYVDTVIPNTYYEDENIKISGWKMANVEGTNIKATLDNNEIEKINYTKRQDVINVIHGYGTIKENPNPGFDFSIKLSELQEGKHTLKIAIVNKNGKELQTYKKDFTIDRNIHIKYRTHVQYKGWQDWKMGPNMAGTSGEGLRLEAIQINASNLPKGVTLKYQTHVQNIGWQEWKTNGEIAGTSGKGLRLEGIRIKLEGTTEYSVVYRTHVQNKGWQDWCYDGETSGTFGEELRLEAIEIKIQPKIKETKTKISIDTPARQTENINQVVKGWVMTTEKDTTTKVLIDEKEIEQKNIKRTERQDVINAIKGYGDETIFNKNPGFETNIDFSKYSLGNHVVKVQVLSQNNVISEATKVFTIRKKIEHSEGTYGVTGLKAIGDNRGTSLKYYKYGSGPNVFFATFAIHGFEDIWAKDGQELVTIANNFYQQLIKNKDFDLAEKWTIYIFPGINLDGLNYGSTNNGPGRTTLFSQAPNNRGIDLNRCWQIGSDYTRYTDSRNYNGTSGFQAYEAQYLRDFLLKNKSQNGQTILVDLHGWTTQVIGDSGICSYYSKQFPENDKSAVGRYGTGYLINWARSSLGSTSKAARSALIELPSTGINGHQSVINHNYSNRYIQATLDMLKNI